MKNDKPTIQDLKEMLEAFCRICYSLGKAEGLRGETKNYSEEICQLPEGVLEEMIKEITKPEEKIMEKIVIPGIKETTIEKVRTSKEKEIELIKKYGKKEMEKLAKQIKFKGQILNNKLKQHAN